MPSVLELLTSVLGVKFVPIKFISCMPKSEISNLQEFAILAAKSVCGYQLVFTISRGGESSVSQFIQ